MSDAVPTPPAPRRWPDYLRKGTILGAWLAMVVVFCEPAYRALDGDLDPSIFSAYAYYTAAGLQFGPEVVAMAGPYGFIPYGSFYGGYLYWLRFGCELGFAGVFSALVLWFFLRLPARSWTRWLWLPVHVLFTSYIADLTVAWAMLLAGFFLLENRASRGWTATLAALLGFFALWKGTHLMLSLATIGVITAAWFLQRDRRRAALVFGAWLGGLLGFWLLARQNPLHLPAYIAGTWNLSSAYNSAMSLDEPAEIFRRGAGVTLGLVAVLALTAWWRRREPLAVAGLALLAGYTFVMWKHGFVRADSHTVIFFSFVTVAIVGWYLQYIARPEATPRWMRAGAFAVAAGLLLVALAGPYDPLRPPLRYLFTSAPSMFRFHWDNLVRPVERRAELEHKLADQRELNQLPEIADTVGRERVDYFGSQQGILLLNGLNYRPRPMGGGAFNVYSPYLMQLNRDFLRDPARRPAFYVARPGSIDNRFVAQDDGLALQDLLQGWRPEVVEQNVLLLRALPPAAAPVPRVLATQTFRFGEAVTVPAVGDDEILLARFVIGETLLGRLRSALYKQPHVSITLQDRTGAALGERRLVPVMAASPFIFSPVIEDMLDVLGTYGREPGRAPGSFVLASKGARFFARKLTVEFSAVPRPPALDPFVINGLRVRLKFPYANAIPEAMTPPFKQHNVVRYVHAPSEVVWSLTGEERAIDFHYGLDPRAYEEGTTNGVAFVVEVRGPSGSVTPAFSRLLRPKTVEADRGKQVAHVPLPVYAPGSKLVLRTDPGEYRDNAWDWSYVTRIYLRQGRFAPEQFPNFSRVPDAAEDENAAVLDLEGKKVLLLHVPGAMRFKLAGTERQLSFDFGFLPGAYTNDGQTPGADYVVELGRPGQPAREIFRRSLQPFTVPGDRGGQSATVTLPPLQPGDILSVRTVPGASGSSSWGWTYFSRLVIE